MVNRSFIVWIIIVLISLFQMIIGDRIGAIHSMLIFISMALVVIIIKLDLIK